MRNFLHAPPSQPFDASYTVSYENTHTLYTMATATIPRTALRVVARTSPSLRAHTPRIATRCLHKQSSPITSSKLQHRPRVQSWAQVTTPPAVTIARRTMFIQTEPTPNADVRISGQIDVWQYILTRPGAQIQPQPARSARVRCLTLPRIH